ncbi:MAG: glycoside hydrolase family 15 protein [Actinobacteria bacterium]|nr:glycoside hydrolase family 15 protein [Actinomycetota bacterium]
MSRPLEDYALIGDTETTALVCRDGSIDWLCLPRFDAPASFAALLGDHRHGRWLLAPASNARAVRRRYRPGTLILETEFDVDGGTARVVDLMPPRWAPSTHAGNPDVVRVVQGVRGRVEMRMQLVIRFDYGAIVPWIVPFDGGMRAIGGPDALTLHTPVELEHDGGSTLARFSVAAGDVAPFVLTWHPSHRPSPEPVDAHETLDTTTHWWQQWGQSSRYTAEWADAVHRSLITLKALTYAPTGGIVAAATTSIPEQIGGVRNWDYRYVWVRDATLTLYALLLGGFREEAVAWRDWLLRAVAGDTSNLNILYGIAGERRLPELTLDWLPGYERSFPVRQGNAASRQIQLDVYGQLMDSMEFARRAGIEPARAAWDLQKALMDALEGLWDQPDHGLWETRGAMQHFTHSKVLAWVAFDRAARAVEQFGLDGPADRWRALAGTVHDEVCQRAFDADRHCFTRSYESEALDASLLMINQVGFIHARDQRFRGTVEAIERELSDGCFVYRYDTTTAGDGLPAGEGAFLLCSFWMVDALAAIGRGRDARERFEQLLQVRNDVGLLAEMYDPVRRRQVGNFPQAFSHVGLVNSACNLATTEGPAHDAPPRDDGRGRAGSRPDGRGATATTLADQRGDGG